MRSKYFKIKFIKFLDLNFYQNDISNNYPNFFSYMDPFLNTYQQNQYNEFHFQSKDLFSNELNYNLNNYNSYDSEQRLYQSINNPYDKQYEDYNRLEFPQQTSYLMQYYPQQQFNIFNRGNRLDRKLI